MRCLSLLFSASALALAAAAPPSQYALWYTDAGVCDPALDGASDDPACATPILPMVLQRATFNNAGVLLSKKNVTDIYDGMGYLSLSPDGKTALFASEDKVSGNVYTYAVDVSTPTPGAPTIVLYNTSNLLAPCAPTCVETSTFHGTFSPDGKTIVFAFRNWDVDGNGIGSQGIAAADADGGNMRILAYDPTEAGIAIMDTCPTPSTDGSRVFFMRTMDQGVTTYPSYVNVGGDKKSAQLLDLPLYADASGCSNFLPTADGVTVFYMGCNNASDPDCSFSASSRKADSAPVRVVRGDADLAWGRAPGSMMAPQRPMRSGSGPSPNNYYSVRMQLGSSPSAWTAEPMFNVPYVDTPDTIDSYGVTQCDGLRGAHVNASVITCQGADPTHSFFQRLFVDPATGNGTVISYNTFRACMTPRCSLLQAIVPA
jgi:hypothetical protein